MSPLRWSAWLASLWAGVLLALGGLSAPALFAVLSRPEAGLAAGRIFASEAYFSLALGAVLLLLLKQGDGGDNVKSSGPPVFWPLVPVLLALAATIVSHFVLQPMMPAARAGAGPWSFAALHMAASGVYAVKTLLVCGLSFVLIRSGPVLSRPTD